MHTMRVGLQSIVQSRWPIHDSVHSLRENGSRCNLCASNVSIASRSSKLFLGGKNGNAAGAQNGSSLSCGPQMSSWMGKNGFGDTTTTRREQRVRMNASADNGDGGIGRYGGDENTVLTEGGSPESSGRAQEFSWPHSQRPRICILGGGFGGLYTALRLDSLLWPPEKRPQIVLIDQGERFLFKPMLYELLIREMSIWEIAPRFEELLENTDILFVRGTISSVLPSDGPDQIDDGIGDLSARPKEEGGRVLLTDGMEIAYDWLVTALGSVTPVSGIPGARELAFPFSTLEDAERVGTKLQELEYRGLTKPEGVGPIRVVVVGAGFAGVELASTVGERLKDKGNVQIVAPSMDICPNGKPGSRDCAKRVLVQRRVNLKLGYYVRELRRKAGAIANGDGDSSLTIIVKLEPVMQSGDGDGDGRGPTYLELEADLVLWTVGTEATVPLLGKATTAVKTPFAFPVNERGKIDTDGFLRVRDHPRVFALGDTAGVVEEDGSPVRATAQVAIQQSDFVAWNVWAAINDRPLLMFQYQHLGEIMTLGAKDATVSMPFLDDLTLDGLIAQAARRVVYWNQFPTMDHKVKEELVVGGMDFDDPGTSFWEAAVVSN